MPDPSHPTRWDDDPDAWLSEILACPVDLSPLSRRDGGLRCEQGHDYPVVQGVPVLLRREEAHPKFLAALDAAGLHGGPPEPPAPGHEVDPFVQDLVHLACGTMYRGLRRRLTRYPIPRLRLPEGHGEAFLDLGCNWGRWCIAAARLGYHPVGIDPSIEGVLAARRIAAQLGVRAAYLVGDARYLPLREGTFDVVHSYSVLQHVSKDSVRAALGSAARVLRPGGRCQIQLPGKLGVRSTYNRLVNVWKGPRDFELRFWTIPELERTFGDAIGPARVSVDGFFNFNPQMTDLDLLPPRYRALVRVSEALRRTSERVPGLRYLADSVYVDARRR